MAILKKSKIPEFQVHSRKHTFIISPNWLSEQQF